MLSLIILMVLALYASLSAGLARGRLTRHAHTRLGLLSMRASDDQQIRELLVYDSAASGGPPIETLEMLSDARNGEMELVDNRQLEQPLGLKRSSALWSLHKGDVQLDCVDIEAMYLGRHELDEAETVIKWGEIMDARRLLFASSDEVPETGLVAVPLGDGGRYQQELDTAIRAVQRASFVSRSLQHSLVLSKQGKDDSSSSLSKDDRSPVTIADYAVQAVIVDAIMGAFPDDKFIAEEDSELLRNDEKITTSITGALNKATVAEGDAWTPDRLFTTVDKGGFDGKAERVWVLDPVDGTKGFLRGDHYCIALALLIDGKPVLSVLGCPNVELEKSVNGIMQSQLASSIIRGTDITQLHTHPSQAGSLFFAVSGMGAFGRSLAMPAGAAVEVCVCPPLRQTGDAVLCESMEANHGDRRVTVEVFSALEMSRDYVRLDGQCKYAVVGAGTAHGNMRLPPSGYVEKIWDHAPGAHFVQEAGGTVTDLHGCPLDFSLGRYMDIAVTGIVASNHKKLQRNLLDAIAEAKKGEMKSDKRVFLD